MTTSTNKTLDRDTVGNLQGLLSVNIDSEKGFEEAAATTKDNSLKQLFTEFGHIRAHNAAELRQHLLTAGEHPTDSGSVAGTLHRWWIDAKQALNGNDPVGVLNETERGEDSIKHTYEDALSKATDAGVRELIQRQYKNVKEGHDRVRQLRDSYRTRNPRG